MTGGEPGARAEEVAIELRVDAVVGRAFRLAGQPLEGIESASKELVELTGGDRRVLERARRVALGLSEADPSKLTRQVASLVRRALELGQWEWD